MSLTSHLFKSHRVTFDARPLSAADIPLLLASIRALMEQNDVRAERIKTLEQQVLKAGESAMGRVTSMKPDPWRAALNRLDQFAEKISTAGTSRGAGGKARDPYDAHFKAMAEGLEWAANQHRGAEFSQVVAENARLKAVNAELLRCAGLAETLKREAQQHAQEARTANATLREIYQCVSLGRGEPGNWHGARPVIECINGMRAAIRMQAEDAEAVAQHARSLAITAGAQ